MKTFLAIAILGLSTPILFVSFFGMPWYISSAAFISIIGLLLFVESLVDRVVKAIEGTKPPEEI